MKKVVEAIDRKSTERVPLKYVYCLSLDIVIMPYQACNARQNLIKFCLILGLKSDSFDNNFGNDHMFVFFLVMQVF